MSQYVVDKTREVTPARGGHGILILPPLFIITVFCFGYVMMQPHKDISASSAASKQRAVSPSQQEAELPPITFSNPATLPTVETTTPQEAQTTAADDSLSVPQSPKDSGSNLQSAGTSRQTITSKTPVVIKQTPATTLTNNASSTLKKATSTVTNTKTTTPTTSKTKK